MNNRFLNMTYAVEVINGRLNTSSPEVERNISGGDNITFTKKVDGKSYSAAVCVKKNMKNYMKQEGFEISEYKKEGKKIIVPAHPAKYLNEDIFGFMRADKEQITEEEYNALDVDIQKIYSKPKKGKSERNITKKRRASFMMNGLIGVNKNKVKIEWGVCDTQGDSDSMPYRLETYSDIMVGLANLNINAISNFKISDNEREFRDYSQQEAEILNINENLEKEEKIKRIEVTLRSLEYLSMESNQSNYLVDTKPKIVIMGEYSWGNNNFQGLINKDGINIEGLKETIDECDEFRNSNIWIGISSKILNENFQGLKEKLNEEFKDQDFIKIGSVKEAFDGYINYLRETF